jgi:hypothetical protein
MLTSAASPADDTTERSTTFWVRICAQLCADAYPEPGDTGMADMSDAVGFSVLVCVTALGLLYLAVHANPREHTIASAIVAAVALPVLVVRPEAGLMLLLAAVLTGRLRMPPVPDTVPLDWQPEC